MSSRQQIIFIVFAIFLHLTLSKKLIGLSPKSAAIDFPDGDDNNDLTRQSAVTGNVTSGILPGLPGAVPVPMIVTPATCICVPTGRCSTNSTNPSDGSGLIDVRIVSGAGIVPTNITIPPPFNTTIVTQTTCAVGLERCCQNGPYQCGIRYPPVTGSRPPLMGQAAFGAYPWQAVLLGPGDVYAGSGALIDSYHVLTAAHRCTDFIGGRPLKVRLGEWDASSDTEPIRSQEYTVSRIFTHPNFNAANLKNDVALLRLSTPVNLGTTPTITTACMPATTFVGARCWVSGWGKNDFSNNGAYQAIQKEVDVPVKANTECESLLRATKLGPSFSFDTASFICAGAEPGKDACTGDGGSPLMCELSGRWFVVGLVAWGIGCATGGVPGVYVNVANFVPWIQATVLS